MKIKRTLTAFFALVLTAHAMDPRWYLDANHFHAVFDKLDSLLYADRINSKDLLEDYMTVQNYVHYHRAEKQLEKYRDAALASIASWDRMRKDPKQPLRLSDVAITDSEGRYDQAQIKQFEAIQDNLRNLWILVQEMNRVLDPKQDR